LETTYNRIYRNFLFNDNCYLTAVDPRKTENVAGIAIGGAVGMMLLAGPVGSATALNPARAFCPMFINFMEDNLTQNFPSWVNFWIWIVGPVAGAMTSGLVCEWFLKSDAPVEGGMVELEVVVGDSK